MRYTREHGCRAWLTYAMLDADALDALLSDYGCAEAVYDRFMREGRKFLKGRIPATGLAMLEKQSDAAMMHNMMVTMQKLQIGILGRDDVLYPECLTRMQDPPALLFYRGNPDCLMGKCVTMVGSRKASPQGIEITRTVARQLSQAGVTIVSGLAMGIDTAAHEGCLEGGSPTAAVLGTGIDVDYPIENASLKDEIVNKGGVLLSEYPLGAKALPHVFHTRNRIMSACGQAVLMMESRIRSGSMLTVQHALNQGREVFAYPGLPGSDWAEGAHQLLREGAIYFTSAADVLEDLGWNDEKPLQTALKGSEAALPPLSDEQRRVYALLAHGEQSFDQLAAETGMTAPELSMALTMLQVMGLIRTMPGKSYIKL